MQLPKKTKTPISGDSLCGRNRTRTYDLLCVREETWLSIKSSSYIWWWEVQFLTSLTGRLSSKSTITILCQDICTRFAPQYEARKGDPQTCPYGDLMQMISRTSVLKERLNCITSQHMLTVLIEEDTALAMHFPQYATVYIAVGKKP
jgi:hypothetical protein